MSISIDSVLTAALSAVSALLAAWFGTQLGLRRFRQERSFDARLEWHRKLAETAKTLLNRTRALPQLRSDVPGEAVVPLVEEMAQLAFHFQEHAEVASLYASRRTCAAVRDTVAAMTKSAQTFRPARDPSSISIEEGRAMRDASLAGLERVYNLLARDLRAMLNLERLDEHRDLDKDVR